MAAGLRFILATPGFTGQMLALDGGQTVEDAQQEIHQVVEGVVADGDVKEIADDNGDKLKVVKVNIDESPQTPGTYGIRSIPTVLVFKDGQVVSQLTGARPKGDFQQLVDGVL